MYNQVKFRGKDSDTGEWLFGCVGFDECFNEYYINNTNDITNYEGEEVDEKTICQFVGLNDSDGNEIYHKDIIQFDNGDKGIVQKEDWLEFFIEWIGEPECEDQTRDFYRIKNSKIIGNVFDNPDMLK